jgi:hypothetical protein
MRSTLPGLTAFAESPLGAEGRAESAPPPPPSPPEVTTSSGIVTPLSREARPVEVVLLVVRAKLTGSLPDTSEVTSHSAQVRAMIRPDDPVTGPTSGMLVWVRDASSHRLSDTGRTSMPCEAVFP